MPDDVRWFRSYVLAEPDGSVGTVSIYQASSADAIRQHAGHAEPPGRRASRGSIRGMPDDTAGDRAHHRRRMSGRDPHEPHRCATPLELLYDLTFVVAFGIAGERAGALRSPRTTSAPASSASRSRRSRSRWAWINYSWFASAYDTDDWVFRLATMVQMVGVIVLALGLRAGVRVDRGRRRPRQRRDGRRLRRDARADGLPVAARRPATTPPRRPAAIAYIWTIVGRPGLLGRARRRRPAARRRRSRSARVLLAIELPARSSPSGARAARPGTRITSPSATACS